MQTKLIERTYKTIDELDESQQQEEFYKWQESNEYTWISENEKSLNSFGQTFEGITVNNWSYGWGESSISFTVCEPQEWEYYDYGTDTYHENSLTGQRLATWLVNNYWWYLYTGKYYHKNGKSRRSKVIFEESCPTGYCMDYTLLKPIRKFIENPCNSTTYEDLMGECLESWIQACKADYDACNSMEYFIDECHANGSMFLVEEKEVTDYERN